MVVVRAGRGKVSKRQEIKRHVGLGWGIWICKISKLHDRYQDWCGLILKLSVCLFEAVRWYVSEAEHVGILLHGFGREAGERLFCGFSWFLAKTRFLPGLKKRNESQTGISELDL